MENSVPSLRGMQLLYLIGFCVFFGSSAGIDYQQRCYGRDIQMHFRYGSLRNKGSLYFTPDKGQNRSRQLLIDNGKVKDPRVKVSSSNVRLTDLKKTDEGVFSLSSNNQEMLDLTKLKVLDCADQFTRTYGEFFTFNIPIQAEYLEFTPLHSEEEPTLLWNRTNPYDYKGGKLQMSSDIGGITSVTQSDNGFYDLRKKDNTLLSRKKLKVEEDTKYYDAPAGKFLLITNPRGLSPWTVIYTREGGTNDVPVVDESTFSRAYFDGRLEVMFDGIMIDSVESRDAGTFKFKDSDGNLAQIAYLKVHSETFSAAVYIGIIFAVVIPGIICCCCAIKCCRRKSSAKRDEPAAAASYRSQNQPADPINAAVPAPDYSYRTVNTLASGQLPTPSSGPPVYTPLNIHVNQPQPEVAPLAPAPAPAPAVNSNFLSSESGPKFELKGIFSSASPLSSDSTYSDVYNSDKLNFL